MQSNFKNTEISSKLTPKFSLTQSAHQLAAPNTSIKRRIVVMTSITSFLTSVETKTSMMILTVFIKPKAWLVTHYNLELKHLKPNGRIQLKTLIMISLQLLMEIWSQLQRTSRTLSLISVTIGLLMICNSKHKWMKARKLIPMLTLTHTPILMLILTLTLILMLNLTQFAHQLDAVSTSIRRRTVDTTSTTLYQTLEETPIWLTLTILWLSLKVFLPINLN